MDEKVLQDRISILDNAVKMLVRSDDQIKTMTQYSDQRAVKTVTQLKSRMKRVQNALSSFKNREYRMIEERERAIAEIELLGKQEELLEKELSKKPKIIVTMNRDLERLDHEIMQQKHMVSIRAEIVSCLEEAQQVKEAVRYILSEKNYWLEQAIVKNKEQRKHNLEKLQFKRQIE